MGSESPNSKVLPRPRRFGLFQAGGIVGLTLTAWFGLWGSIAEPKTQTLGVILGIGFACFVGLIPLILFLRWVGYRELQVQASATEHLSRPAPVATDLREINESLISWRERALKAEAALVRVPRPAPPPPPTIPRWPEADRDEIANDPRWYEGEKGKLATFVYSDADGVVTDRRIRNWRSRYAYIEGFCLDRQEERTFRKDRIEDWEAE